MWSDKTVLLHLLFVFSRHRIIVFTLWSHRNLNHCWFLPILWSFMNDRVNDVNSVWLKCQRKRDICQFDCMFCTLNVDRPVDEKRDRTKDNYIFSYCASTRISIRNPFRKCKLKRKMFFVQADFPLCLIEIRKSTHSGLNLVHTMNHSRNQKYNNIKRNVQNVRRHLYTGKVHCGTFIMQ